MRVGSSVSATIEMVVPDGVAAVTLRYPPRPADGHHPDGTSPAFTITTAPVSNLVLVDVPRSAGGRAISTPSTMVWRAANGHVIKTFHRL